MKSCFFCFRGLFKEEEIKVIIEGNPNVICKKCDETQQWE